MTFIDRLQLISGQNTGSVGRMTIPSFSLLHNGLESIVVVCLELVFCFSFPCLHAILSHDSKKKAGEMVETLDSIFVRVVTYLAYSRHSMR